MILLKITTTPIEYTLQIESPSLKPLDEAKSAECANSFVKKTNKFSSQIGERSDKTKLTRSKSNSSVPYSSYPPAGTQQSAAKSVTFNPNYLSSIESISSQIPEAFNSSWEPSPNNNDEENLIENLQNRKTSMEYVPGSIRMEIEHLAEVNYEYLGGMRYVPPSSDPNDDSSAN